jgi:hypothetical protein
MGTRSFLQTFATAFPETPNSFPKVIIGFSHTKA